jgi:ribosomal protein S8
LKYSLLGVGFFSNITFLKKQEASLRKIKSLSVANKNYYYLVLTSKGVVSADRCIAYKTGGFLIAR